MKINSDTLPVILGSSILLLVFTGVGGMLISYSSSRTAQEKQDLQDSFAAYQKKQEDKFKISAPSLPPAQGTGDAAESEELRMGSYSNPPTNLTSFGSSATTSRIERPIGDRFLMQSLMGETPKTALHRFSRSLGSSNLTRTQSDFRVGNRRSSLTDKYNSDTNISSESLVDSLETDTSFGSINSTSSSFSRNNSTVRVDAFEE